MARFQNSAPRSATESDRAIRHCGDGRQSWHLDDDAIYVHHYSPRMIADDFGTLVFNLTQVSCCFSLSGKLNRPI
jgi:hypothetical protein